MERFSQEKNKESTVIAANSTIQVESSPERDQSPSLERNNNSYQRKSMKQVQFRDIKSGESSNDQSSPLKRPSLLKQKNDEAKRIAATYKRVDPFAPYEARQKQLN